MTNLFTFIIFLGLSLSLMGWCALWNHDLSTAVGFFIFSLMTLVSMLVGNYIRVTNKRNHYDK